MKKVFVKSYGCQMNVYDSGRMADVLAGEGFSQTAAMAEADLVVLNTCHIREKAAEKVYSELGRVKALKRARAAEGRETTIVVAGCVAQAEGSEILRRAPAVDVVVGPQSYHRLPELLAKARTGPVVDTDFPVDDKFDHLPARRRNGPAAAASRPSSPSRKAATSSAPFASCPIPAAPSCRGRWRGSSRRRSASPPPACAR